MQVSYVTPEDFDYVWDKIKAMIRKGLRHGQGDSLTEDSLKKSIHRGDNLLLVAHDDDEVYAGIIVEITQYPNKKTVFVVLVAGKEINNWGSEVEAALKMLKYNANADTIEASCRSGMAKYLMNRSWKQKALIMELPDESN